MPVKNIIGERFGRLVVVKPGKRPLESRVTNTYWFCECDCGGSVSASSNNLRSGSIVSCGCYRREQMSAVAAKYNFRHGHNVAGKETRTHKSWVSMLQRCKNSRRKDFPDYGGRGIKVCERWSDYVNFLADMGERPEGMTLDRIDVNGDYEPSNCRWATPSDQQRNKRCHVK